MSKIKQAPSQMADSRIVPFKADHSRIPTDAEIRDAVQRGRRMQARAIAGLFSRLGK